MNFAPMLANPDVELSPSQFLLIYATQQFLDDLYRGRMPLGQSGWFHHGNVENWPYPSWSTEAARELFKSNWLTTGHPDDTLETKARWVRLNLNRCYYSYTGTALYFHVGSAIFNTECIRYDLNQILITLGELQI